MGLKALKLFFTTEAQASKAYNESVLTRALKTSSRGGLTRCRRLQSVCWPGRHC
jgi:hypothetical protein